MMMKQKELKDSKKQKQSDVKTVIEQYSGINLQNVTYHFHSPIAKQYNANAIAHGESIEFATSDRSLEAHELWHIVQQKKGKVSKQNILDHGAAYSIDPQLEMEADRISDLVFHHQLPVNTVESKEVKGPDIYQFSLKVGANDYSRRANDEDVETLADEVLRNIYREIKELRRHDLANAEEFKKNFYLHIHEIRKQIIKWIPSREIKIANALTSDDVRAASSSHFDHTLFGRKEQVREYSNHIDLFKGVLGWIRGKVGRHLELLVANEIYRSDAVKSQLVHFINVLYAWYGRLERHYAMSSELCSETYDVPEGDKVEPIGEYAPYFKHLCKIGILGKEPHSLITIFREPHKSQPYELAILLHDLQQYFMRSIHLKERDKILRPNPAEEQVLLDIDEGGHMIRTLLTKRVRVPLGDSKNERAYWRGMGKTTSTRNEKAPSTIIARKRNLPIWASQSMTTARILSFIRQVDIKMRVEEDKQKKHLTAASLIIAAFWRKDYDHKNEFAYHTFHEVFDVALNFGVDYRVGSVDILTLEPYRGIPLSDEDLQRLKRKLMINERILSENYECLKRLDRSSLFERLEESIRKNIDRLRVLIDSNSDKTESIVNIERQQYFIMQHLERLRQNLLYRGIDTLPLRDIERVYIQSTITNAQPYYIQFLELIRSL